jgi:hypothetical protein
VADAALAYYHTNRDAIDAEMAAEGADADCLEREHRAARTPSAAQGQED